MRLRNTSFQQPFEPKAFVRLPSQGCSNHNLLPFCFTSMAILKSPGLLLLVGAVEMLMLIHVAEFLYPGYSVSEDYISKLGVGPAAPRLVFTVALIAFGVLVLAAAYMLRERDRKSRLWLMLTLSAVGAIGVGVFDMDNFRELHGLSALLAFLFGNLGAVYSSRNVRAPLSYAFAFLGLLGLSALALLAVEVDLGLGLGGIERMVFYPAMFWVLAYGTYVLAEEPELHSSGSPS